MGNIESHMTFTGGEGQNSESVKMGILIPIIVMTLFWGLIGLIGPFIIPKGPNRW